MATRSWNKVELIGNLTRDPELRYTPSGTAVATFTIATNRTYMSEGEKKEEADFHKIVAWAKLGELCSQLLKKGNRVFVSGRLQNRSWEGNDGVQRNVTEVNIEDMILLTSNRNGTANTMGVTGTTETPPQPAAEAGEPEASQNNESQVQPEEQQPPTNSETQNSPEDAKQDQKNQKPQALADDLEDLPF